MKTINNNIFIDIIINFYKELAMYFNIPFKKIKKVPRNLVSDIYSDSFYRDFLKERDLQMILSKDSLLSLITYLKDKGLRDNIIKSILLNTPTIVLFSLDKEAIYPIFKGQVCQGFLLLNQDSYRSYKVLDQDYDPDLNIKSYMLNYDYIVKEMLDVLNREDIKSTLDIDRNSDLKTKCDKLVKNYSLKNYFFK